MATRRSGYTPQQLRAAAAARAVSSRPDGLFTPEDLARSLTGGHPSGRPGGGYTSQDFRRLAAEEIFSTEEGPLSPTPRPEPALHSSPRSGGLRREIEAAPSTPVEETQVAGGPEEDWAMRIAREHAPFSREAEESVEGPTEEAGLPAEVYRDDDPGAFEPEAPATPEEAQEREEFAEIMNEAIGGYDSGRATGVFLTIAGVEVPMMRADTKAGRDWNAAVFKAQRDNDPTIATYLQMASQRRAVVNSITGRDYEHSDLMGIDADTTTALATAYQRVRAEPATPREKADSLADLAIAASRLQDSGSQAIIIDAMMSMIDFQDSGLVEQVTWAAENANPDSPTARTLRGARTQLRAQRREAAPQRSPLQSLAEVEAEVERDIEARKAQRRLDKQRVGDEAVGRFLASPAGRIPLA